MRFIKSIFHFFKSRLRTKKRLAIFVITVLVVGGLIGRYVYQRTKPPVYETYEIVKTDLVKSIEVSGEIKAEEKVDLHFQTLGKLAWVGVKEGERVKKWQAIASLDKRTLEKQLKQDLIAFEKEYRDYQQSVDDNPQVSHRLKRILEKAQFDLDSEVLDVEIKNLAIELASLVSPIEGIVTNIDTPIAGVNVTATDYFTVVNPETVYFEVEVDESDISGLKVEQKAEIVLDAYEDEAINAEVLDINFESSTSDGGGTVFLVQLSLPLNEDLKFRLGMSGDADIILEEKEDVVTVPFDYVIERNGDSFVDVMNDSKQIERTEIETGTFSDESVEILSGVEEGQLVVIPQ